MDMNLTQKKYTVINMPVPSNVKMVQPIKNKINELLENMGKTFLKIRDFNVGNLVYVYDFQPGRTK